MNVIFSREDLEMTTSPTPDPAGAHVEEIGPSEVEELQKVLAASGLPEVSLDGRYSVIFVYPGLGAGERFPELAGCTAELCTFADETTEFVKHGIQLAGLSTQPTETPGDFLGAFPFPVGRLLTTDTTSLIEVVSKGEDSYATRKSFVIYPDGTGLSITNIQDPVGHVTKCFQVAIDRRLAEYREAALSFFDQKASAVRSTMTHTGFLANGADSVSISTVDFEARLVAKMASPDIVSQEGGYMQRINRMLEDRQKSPLFPDVLSIRTDQRHAYYLMESANPQSLDYLLFEDEAMTRIRRDRMHLLSGALEKLANLYEISFRAEEPAVARYHYLDRFVAVTERRDFKDTHEFMFGEKDSLIEILSQPFVIDGNYQCRSFNDQLEVLRSRIDSLVQPVGAYLHGDVHLKNMLVAEDGRTVVYVDPRIVWDGNDVGDPGFGDPLYDFGTLLHSLHVMSSILTAIDAGETGALMAFRETDVDGIPGFVTAPGLLPIAGSQTVDWFIDWLERTVPSRILGAHWRARLHVNTANALFGWLKYARAIRTREAWLAVFAATLFHLESAARQLEGTEEGS